ncbi:MAG: 1-deoxy-D-xylulose-5-phosphate synthase [Brevinema sp.]
MKYTILDNINFPNDLKKIAVSDLHILAQEIRHFLIENITKTGGHLAPNLGIVELTIALHYVFDSPRDSLIWDVGHQAYVHKILTGRKDLFPTLRQKKGLAGFPTPKESKHDLVHVGHSSTSVSLATGIATAKKINHDSSATIAIIGDGSFTSGMVYEALNDASWRDLPIIVILNDNKMSISENVGGISLHLNKLRTNKQYLNLKKHINKFLRASFSGRLIAGKLYNLKSFIKNIMYQQENIFENLGVSYQGPFDGHNIEQLINLFEEVKNNQEPLLLHVITKKGQGHVDSLSNPINFHGISGSQQVSSLGKTWSQVFGDCAISFAEKDSRVVLITAAMREGTGLVKYAQKFPKRFIDVGIAEQHAVTCAAGLAIQGKKPIVAIYSTFLQRAYDQIVHDVAIGNIPVIFCLDRAGLIPADGMTHQGVFDIAYLRTIPNMTIMAPLTEEEFLMMIEFAINLHAPVAIRYPKDHAPQLSYHLPQMFLGQGVELESGDDGVFVILGSLYEEAIKARTLLKEKSQKDYALYHLRFAKPIAITTLQYLASKKNIILIEEGVRNLGDYLHTELIKIDSTLNIVLKNTGDSFPDVDSRAGLIEDYGFSPEALIKNL